MTVWTEYTALGIPPAYIDLDLEVEVIRPYDGENIKEVVRTTGYFDPALNEFHDSWGCVRGDVLRWRQPPTPAEASGVGS